MHDAAPPPLRRLLRWSVTATLLVTLVVAAATLQRGGISRLLFAGELGPSVEVLRADFDDPVLLTDDTGHDGQQFYVVARSLPHLHDAVPGLDERPAYRAQRIALPLLARLVAPGVDRGNGLVWALLVANALGVLAGCVGLGALVVARGGPVWSAALFAILPGSLMSLQLTLVDAFAIGFALAAVAALERERPWTAFALATVGVLGKETVVVVLVGYCLYLVWHWRSVWRCAPMAAAAAVGVAWAQLMEHMLGGERLGGGEFVLPLTGYWHAIEDTWNGVPGTTWVATGMSVLVLVGLVVLTLVARRRGPWPFLCGTLAVYCSMLAAHFLDKMINSSRLTLAGLVVCLGTILATPDLPWLTPHRAAPASDP